MPLESASVIINHGDSLSEPLDCGGGDLVRITTPVAWTPALLTFQLSTDNAVYSDLFDGQGNEIAINIQPGVTMLVPQFVARALGFIRFRSGTRDRPVPQQEWREFVVALLKGQ